MAIQISPEERLSYLILMAGSTYKVLYEIYKNAGEETKQKVISEIGKSFLELEAVMDMYDLGRNPEDIANAMLLTEDLIGCEPKGKLFSVSADEAVRKVTSCPWTTTFSNDGGTCRMMMAATEEGLGRKYGLEIICEQCISEGAEYCIWKVRKRK